METAAARSPRYIYRDDGKFSAHRFTDQRTTGLGGRKDQRDYFESRRDTKTSRNTAPVNKWYMPIQFRRSVALVMGNQSKTGDISITTKIAKYFGTETIRSSSRKVENTTGEASAIKRARNDKQTAEKTKSNQKKLVQMYVTTKTWPVATAVRQLPMATTPSMLPSP